MRMKAIMPIGLLVCCMACEQTPPEQVIRAHMDRIQQAVEAKQAGEVLDFIADDFEGARGFDKQGLRRLLLAQFLRHGAIKVLVTQMDVKMGVTAGDRALIEGVVLVTGADRWLPKEGRLYKVTGEWRLRDGDWLLVKLAWE